MAPGHQHERQLAELAGQHVSHGVGSPERTAAPAPGPAEAGVDRSRTPRRAPVPVAGRTGAAAPPPATGRLVPPGRRPGRRGRVRGPVGAGGGGGGGCSLPNHATARASVQGLRCAGGPSHSRASRPPAHLSPRAAGTPPARRRPGPHPRRGPRVPLGGATRRRLGREPWQPPKRTPGPTTARERAFPSRSTRPTYPRRRATGRRPSRTGAGP